MPQAKFSKRSCLLLGNFAKWRGDDKARYLEHFSPANWASLSGKEKSMHAATGCKACQLYHLGYQVIFPAKSKDAMSNCVRAVTNGLRTKAKKTKNVTEKAKKVAKAIYGTINAVYKATFSTELADALIKVPELQLATRVSKRPLQRES